ncbi:GLPGLI family protein [uncultured Capnocytophaga sp.]|uniref:GLPGLI family protein n=1 Tax=uncultured Capnocytophaga sp. TaxID=159273 RepID=UPI0026190FE5|nr:GLPGLI family protein [uncultured Capnocytophaga sp.]
MKKIFIFIYTFFILFSYGQGNDKILKVTYTHHVLLSKKGDFDTVLYADDTHSQFVFDQKPKSFKTDEGYDMTFPSVYYISDYNFQTQYIHDNRLLNGVMLSSQWKNDLVWQITDEEKEIAGYKVRKATTDSYGDKGFEFYKRKAIAWFTTDIPIPTGPERYYGLPGLIVELYYERTREGYSLKKVEQVSKEDYTFVPLTDENAIGKDEMIYNYLRSKEVKAILKAAKKKKK